MTALTAYIIATIFCTALFVSLNLDIMATYHPQQVENLHQTRLPRSIEYLTQDQCDLLKGFDLINGCQGNSPFENDWDHPQVSYQHNDIIISEKLNSKRSLVKEISEMIKARGNGWGNYDISTKEWFDHYVETIDSVTWTLNEIRKTEYIQSHLESAKLSSDALNTLQTDPQGFVESYGQYFVAAKYMGSEFQGTFIVTTKDQKLLQQAQTAIGESAISLIKNGNVDAYNQLKQANPSLEQKFNQKTKGNVKAETSILNIQNMYKAFDKVTDKVPLTVVVVPYSEVPEIKAIISKSRSKYQIFYEIDKITNQDISDISRSSRAGILTIAILESYLKKIGTILNKHDTYRYQRLVRILHNVKFDQRELETLKVEDIYNGQYKYSTDLTDTFLTDADTIMQDSFKYVTTVQCSNPFYSFAETGSCSNDCGCKGIRRCSQGRCTD